jgi:hypothetical protein
VSIEKQTDEILALLRPAMKQALQAAYDRGQEDMVDKIFTAADAYVKHKEGGEVTAIEAKVAEKPAKRAPRGLLGAAVSKVLTKHPGLKVADIERRAVEIDSRISPKSVGNELRRWKGKKYRRDNKLHWFLLGDDAETETAGSPSRDTPAASSRHTQGGSNGAALDLI